MSSLGRLTSDQIFAAALAYESNGCDIPIEEFLQKIASRYEEIDALNKKAHPSVARVGNRRKLGI